MIVTFTVKAEYDEVMRGPWEEFKIHEKELAGQLELTDFVDMVDSALNIVSVANVEIED